jgi:RNA polymerase sigma factor (TIGR02999 family)
VGPHSFRCRRSRESRLDRVHPASSVTGALWLVGAARDPQRRAEASERLAELVYDDLRRIAARLLKRERPGQTLQPTALVHEAYLKLFREDSVPWQDRAHFLGVAARAMRQILVDRARRRAAAKRGPERRRVTLSGEAGLDPGQEMEVLELNDALSRFAEIDPRAARIAEMRIFAGMTVREVAQVLEVSPRTVDGDWAVARAWLSRQLRGTR